MMPRRISGFYEAGRVTGRALSTLLLYGPLLRFVERRNLLGVRIMAALALFRGLARGEWILAAAVLILSFLRSTARYFKAGADLKEPTSGRGEVMNGFDGSPASASSEAGDQ